jgi:hypothetical protein
MWLPKWLGENYCRLYAEVGTRMFDFGDALRTLQQPEGKLRVILSELRRSGFMDVIARKNRKRMYRLADPREVASILGRGIGLQKVPDVIRAILRSFLHGLFESYGERVVSIVLYGSFARERYGPESDIDLLLVIDGYKRDEEFYFETANELITKQWELAREYHVVTPYPLSVEQAKYHRPIYLDIIIDGVTLYDKGGFISGVFEEIRGRLAELGAKRYELPDGSWYWILKPEVKEGEVFEI